MLKLAICEDDVIQCEQIQCLTQSSLRIPFEFDIFSSAKGFLKQISNKKCPYQIVLMDIELGSESMSGINLAKKNQFLKSKHADYFYQPASEICLFCL